MYSVSGFIHSFGGSFAIVFLMFFLQFIDLSSVFVWLLNQFHLVAVYWLVCRDRNSPLCHIRVSLTSCIGAGHIIFFAGIDSTANQVTFCTPTFVVTVLVLVCLFVFWFVCLFFFNLTVIIFSLFFCLFVFCMFSIL